MNIIGIKDKKEFLYKYIGENEVYKYLTAEWGEVFGIYEDGSVITGQSVGMEINSGDMPLTSIRCPGVGNIDMTYFEEGFADAELYTDEEIIKKCCEEGDVIYYVEELQEKLLEAWGDGFPY